MYFINRKQAESDDDYDIKEFLTQQAHNILKILIDKDDEEIIFLLDLCV